MLLRTEGAGAGCLALPGAFNGLVGRAAADAGFRGCYVSGAALSASQGIPDVGLVGLDGFVAAIRELARAVPGLPLLADADTGFDREGGREGKEEEEEEEEEEGEGDEMVVRAVLAYAAAGAAGLHIEDQVFPKRCGHLDGKTLVSADAFAAKVARAAWARDHRLGGEFVVCARTDARSVPAAEGGGLEEAVRRLKLYVDAGADMVFPEGLATEEEFRHVAEELRGYRGGEAGGATAGGGAGGGAAAAAVAAAAAERGGAGGGVGGGAGGRVLAPCGGPFLLANMTEFGKTPLIPLRRFGALGYHATIFPVGTLRAAMGAVTGMLRQLRAGGEVGASLGGMQTRAELYELLRYTPGEEWRGYPREGGEGGA